MVDSLEMAPSEAEAHAELSEEEQWAEALQHFKKAGDIAASIKKDAKSLVMPGESALDVAETIEKMIFDAGAQPGFPCNISINEVAAHFTPEANDTLLFGEKDVVKLDLGVAVEGCIADTAFSVDLSGEQDKLMDAARAAVEAGVAGIKPGVRNGAVGKLIEHEIRSRGFKPIENLTGHMIQPYTLHAGVEIPNVGSNASYEFEEGDVFAVEPFATTGAGRVVDQPQVEIFAVAGEGKLRMRSSRELLLGLVRRYFTLPFAERWLVAESKSKLLLSAAMRELLQAGCLHPYPVLREADRGLVTQFEHTVIVERDGARVITGATDP